MNTSGLTRISSPPFIRGISVSEILEIPDIGANTFIIYTFFPWYLVNYSHVYLTYVNYQQCISFQQDLSKSSKFKYAWNKIFTANL